MIKALTVSKNIVFIINQVPVTVKVEFDLFGGYSLDAAAKGSAGAAIKCTSAIAAGAEYKNNVWSDIWAPKMDCKQVPPKPALGAKADLRVHLRPEIKALLYHSSGVTLDVEPYLLLSGQGTAAPVDRLVPQQRQFQDGAEGRQRLGTLR